MDEHIEDTGPPVLRTIHSKPLLIYGTSRKENRTAFLTETALNIGFTAVDTANYPPAYKESHTGDGIAAALKSGVVKRGDLWIQTKFCPAFAMPRDQLPYNPDQSIEGQVKESIQQSLENLKVEYLDAFLLHGPYRDNEDSIAAYKAFEQFVPHTIKQLGVSNVSLQQLKAVYDAASVKPTIVQNRFMRDTSYDIEVRHFCAGHNITYQAFYMLTHNPELLASDVLASVAERLNIEKEVAFYVLVLSLGDVQVLDGTTQSVRMKADLTEITSIFKNDRTISDLKPFVIEFKKLLQTSV
ncbi:NADP-dependent oxidoreductase domain-containing protein [Truncatella angustata]|uniref:NADP-dependent oxidoreductase domain-containing protein n=1 Tax=Truncatella angustata TaxID=152316 RepID=A0A9P8UWC8_9PEZI|nr:NADP-dependent oxidoreductase domain-containing protein [Truncatella angustata]KAH6659422.1 NADP-dependent oxidoreductase domain-containing protein [Truncatella angustata]